MIQAFPRTLLKRNNIWFSRTYKSVKSPVFCYVQVTLVSKPYELILQDMAPIWHLMFHQYTDTNKLIFC